MNNIIQSIIPINHVYTHIYVYLFCSGLLYIQMESIDTIFIKTLCKYNNDIHDFRSFINKCLF